MLLQFSVGNYRSFKDPVTFSTVTADLPEKSKKLNKNNVISISNSLSLLKSCAIYGANASGKSNLIEALSFMRRFVLRSAIGYQVTDQIDVEKFRLNNETKEDPSYFEINVLLKGKEFRYGFEVDAHKVHAEWLYHVPRVRESKLFIREDGEFSLSNVFKEGKGLTNKTRDNALLLSVVAQFNGEISQSILKWFGRLSIVYGLQYLKYRDYTVEKIQNENFKNDVLSLVREMDLGISDLQVEKSDPASIKYDNFGLEQNGKQPARITTIHKNYAADVSKNNEKIPVSWEYFDFDKNESEGTKKIFSLAGPIIDALRNGKTLIIDELDARLHPLVTSYIIELFNSKTSNPHDAQLIFTTHNTNLLSDKLFRRDQIWFTEKDKYGASSLYSLAEYQVRHDAPFEKDYISGRYGAIPFMGSTHRLVGATNA